MVSLKAEHLARGTARSVPASDWHLAISRITATRRLGRQIMQLTFANRENGIDKRAWGQLSKLGWLTILAFVLGLSTAASAQTPKLTVRGKLQYVHGINIAWMFGRYSTDLGINPLHPQWGCGYNSTTANNWLNDIDQMKVNVVRLWLFEGMEGLTFDSSGHVSGIQATFLTNLDDMIAKANAKGLAYELVLLVHTADLELGKPLPNGVIIKNFLTDTTARQKFLANAVRPLAVRYQGNQAVFSYDIMNEADLGVMRGVCNRTQMRAFVTACASEIHNVDAAAQVTCSCAFYKFNSLEEHNTWFGGLGLDYYENHNYATVPDLKVVPAWLDKPLLLGEYGPSLPAPDYTGQRWTEEEQNSSVTAHLTQAESRGWAGTMAWMYWHSTGFGENITKTPGGANVWETTGTTIKTFGSRYFDPAPALKIYDETLAINWANWSWGCTASFGNTFRVFSGTKSIVVDASQPWSAVSLRKGTALSTAGYSKVRFAIYTPNRARAFAFYTQTTDNGAASPVYNFVSTANAWTQVTVNLSDIGNPTSIKRINIQSMTGTAIGRHWIDAIELIP
jgi:hypothetical protein